MEQPKKPTIDEIAQYWNLNEEETEKFKKAKKGAYNPLQTKLKVMIGDGTGLETILITLKHYTGALIVTGNENVAWYHHVVRFLK
ncbi:hypothetical protein [Bacillus pumilus]|uniref:hypothetical protein n=1 Tax=Bacillus pumilus TaxID=1408 RepID=UPI0025A10AF1|nr:hypothetical protein [Bacillus pumilus]